MKNSISYSALAAVALGLAYPLAAQAPAPVPAVGATVYDTADGVVGTVGSVSGGIVTVDTGTHKVAVGAASFAAGPKGPVLGLTKAQLDSAAAKADADAAAALAAQLVPGAAIYGSAGGQAGTVKAADAEFVTVATAKGVVRLPRAAFASTPQGPAIGMTAAQLEAAVAANQPASGK